MKPVTWPHQDLKTAQWNNFFEDTFALCQQRLGKEAGRTYFDPWRLISQAQIEWVDSGSSVNLSCHLSTYDM